MCVCKVSGGSGVKEEEEEEEAVGINLSRAMLFVAFLYLNTLAVPWRRSGHLSLPCM